MQIYYQALNPFPLSFECSLKIFWTHLISSLRSSSRYLLHFAPQPNTDFRSHLHHHLSDIWNIPKSLLPSIFKVPIMLLLYLDSCLARQIPTETESYLVSQTTDSSERVTYNQRFWRPALRRVVSFLVRIFLETGFFPNLFFQNLKSPEFPAYSEKQTFKKSRR